MSRVRQARRRAGLSQEELAKASGVSPATVVQVELGNRRPQGRTLRKLAAALEMEVADLIEEEEAPAPKVLSRPSPEAPEAQADEERREELRKIRELLTDAHGLFEELADEYKVTGATDKLTTLASVAMFSVMGAEQFVQEEVGPAEDRASTRVYAAGNRLEEFVEDLLETIQSTTTEPVGGEVAYLDALRRRRAS